VAHYFAVDDYAEVNRANGTNGCPRMPRRPITAWTSSSPIGIPQRGGAFDLPLLGDISGLRGVHLQCHIGTDTISLAWLGAS
jgi:hypothetical protein